MTLFLVLLLHRVVWIVQTALTFLSPIFSPPARGSPYGRHYIWQGHDGLFRADITYFKTVNGRKQRCTHRLKRTCRSRNEACEMVLAYDRLLKLKLEGGPVGWNTLFELDSLLAEVRGDTVKQDTQEEASQKQVNLSMTGHGKANALYQADRETTQSFLALPWLVTAAYLQEDFQLLEDEKDSNSASTQHSDDATVAACPKVLVEQLDINIINTSTWPLAQGKDQTVYPGVLVEGQDAASANVAVPAGSPTPRQSRSDCGNGSSVASCSEDSASRATAAAYNPTSVLLQQPQRMPQATPQLTPQLTPQAIPQPTPQAVPQAIPQANHQANPQATALANHQAIPQAIPQVIPQAVPQPIPHAISQAIIQPAPQAKPQANPQASPQASPQPHPHIGASTSQQPTASYAMGDLLKCHVLGGDEEYAGVSLVFKVTDTLGQGGFAEVIEVEYIDKQEFRGCHHPLFANMACQQEQRAARQRLSKLKPGQKLALKAGPGHSALPPYLQQHYTADSWRDEVECSLYRERFCYERTTGSPYVLDMFGLARVQHLTAADADAAAEPSSWRLGLLLERGLCSLQDLLDKHGGFLGPLAVHSLFQSMLVPMVRDIGRNGIIWRDVKPANIMLCQDATGNVVLKAADFGVAHVMKNNSHWGSGAAGTPGYIAPEALAQKKYGLKADAYSLGCTFLQCRTGQVPGWYLAHDASISVAEQRRRLADLEGELRRADTPYQHQLLPEEVEFVRGLVAFHPEDRLDLENLRGFFPPIKYMQPVFAIKLVAHAGLL